MHTFPVLPDHLLARKTVCKLRKKNGEKGKFPEKEKRHQGETTTPFFQLHWPAKLKICSNSFPLVFNEILKSIKGMQTH